MGFRYRRSIRLGKGLRLNLSKSGTSLSVGGRGATMSISKRGTRTTLGLPGTGLSYSTTTRKTPGAGGGLIKLIIGIGIAVAIINALAR